MARLLEGIKVLEVANWVAAPSACAMLADLGADVVKVEHPETGDPVRNIDVQPQGIVPGGEGLNPAFEQLNRGKRSIAVNLNTSSGQALVRRLAAGSDILVTNLVAQRQERYGLRYEDVTPLNPRLIYVVLTGYGMAGPERDRLGFDYAAFWARSGIMASIGEAGTPPVQQRPGMGDQATSLALTTAIGMSLYERERSGKGQRIECSLLHTALWMLGLDVSAALRHGEPVQRHARQNAANPLSNYYRTRDDKWIQLVMFESDRFWPGFCRALEIDQLVNDPRFDSLANRAENRAPLLEVIEKQFVTRTTSEWGIRLDAAGCIWAPVQSLDEVVIDPQVRANGYAVPLTHAEAGDFELVSMPMKLGRTPGAPAGPAPELGQHTETTLLDLGFSWEEIGHLKDQGAII
ncbi:MAG: CoA transferase [Chloroflexi bacterium]|nr:CoA transferase [Chloroflexota bacterium]